MFTPEWKVRLHNVVANAEYTLFASLSKAGLTRGMTTGKSITLMEPCEAYPKGIVTIPDFSWFDLCHAVYLDGKATHRRKRLEKDDVVNELMAEKGWTVQRFPYSPPISHKALISIVKSVAQALNKKRGEVG